MTSREDIALQITLANISDITHISKSNNEFNIDALASNIAKFYNLTYENIKTNDKQPLQVLI